MRFHAILLLLLAIQTTSAARLKHSQSSILGANLAADRTNVANELSPAQQTSSPIHSYTSRKRSKQDAQAQTFIGTVEWEYKPLSWDCDVPNCDHFALYVDATRTNYELDDARAALPYEGMRAKVTGVVDTKNSTIHLISIERVK
jgi:hypothetical protein